MTRLKAETFEKAQRGNQIIPARKLLCWLNQLGFTARRPAGGSSHISVTAPDHLEIDPFLIVTTTKRPDDQKKVARFCLMALEALQEKNETVSAQFENAIEHKSIEGQSPSDDYQVIYDNVDHTYYLQHVSYSQVVTELPGYTEGKAFVFQEYEDYLDKRLQKLEDLLDEATEKKGFHSTRYANGTILLEHETYPIHHHIKAFSLKNPNFTIHSELEEVIDIVDRWRDESNRLLSNLVTNFAGKERSSPKKDKVSYCFKVFNAPHYLTFDYKNEFIPYEQILHAYFYLNHFDWKGIPRFLQEYNGITITNNTDGKHKVTCDFFEDMEAIEIENMHIDPTTIKQCLEFDGLTIDQKYDKIEELWKKKNERQKSITPLNTYVSLVMERARKQQDKLYNTLSASPSWAIDTTSKLVRKNNGKPTQIPITIADAHIQIPGVALTTMQKGSKVYIIEDKDLETLRLKISAQIKNAKPDSTAPAFSKSALSSLIGSSDDNQSSHNDFPKSPLSNIMTYKK